MDNYEDCVYDHNELIYGYPTDEAYDFAVYEDTVYGGFSFEFELFPKFENEDDQKRYIKTILKNFAQWMIENDHDVAYTLRYQDVFNSGISSRQGFDTIEQVYAAFKILVLGYVREASLNKTLTDSLKYNVTFGWDEKAGVWVAEGKNPEFTLEHESLATLAQRVEKIIPEMVELNDELNVDSEDSLEKWLVVSDPVRRYGLYSRNEWKSYELRAVLEKYVK